jgi:hypothetical protein
MEAKARKRRIVEKMEKWESEEREREREWEGKKDTEDGIGGVCACREGYGTRRIS